MASADTTKCTLAPKINFYLLLPLILVSCTETFY